MSDPHTTAGAPPGPAEDLSLAGDFPAATRAEWVEAVDRTLGRSGRIDDDAAPGAGVRTLTRTSLDGIEVAPLYTADDDAAADPAGVPGAAPFVRGGQVCGTSPDGWDVRTAHAEPDPDLAREAVTVDLNNGAHSIWLAVGDGGSLGAGTAVADLATVLREVHLDLAPVVLDAGAAAPEAAEAYLAVAADRGVAPGALLGTLGLDPIGVRARTGTGPEVETVAPTGRRIAAEHPLLRVVVVDAVAVHAAGSSDAQELGYSLAAGVAYLRVLTAAPERGGAGLDVATAARLLEFRYAATAEQFPTIAKLRAARRLWSRVTEACGAAAAQAQHAVGSPVMLTRRDPYVNLLRGTVAGLAAGLGGAEAVTVAPFDAALARSGPFSRRIARNTGSLLTAEAQLARVIDPAGGSWYVEALTDALARRAWTFFQEIETAGGVLAALDSGLVADRVAVVREQRRRAVATRCTPITGVGEFPNLAEDPPPRWQESHVTAATRQRRGVADVDGQGDGLPVYRAAEQFEVLRDRSDATLAETGSRPRAFLATLGPLAAHTARAGFARNLLEAGGIEVTEAGPTETADEVVAAFAEAGTPVAVLCGTDALYDARAAGTVEALRAAGARRVLIAGRHEVPGVDGRLHAGSDAIAANEAVYAALEEMS